MSGGAGAVVGAALAAMLARHHAALASQVTKGRLLMWVRTRSPELEAWALRILSTHAATHVHSHSFTA